MAYRYTIDENVNCVFIQHFDIYTFEEGIVQMEDTAANPNYQLGMNFLRDASRTTLPPEYCLEWFKEAAGSSLPEVYKKLGLRRKVAWVLGNAKDFRTIHQWAALTRFNEYAVERRPFRSIENALEWLEIPEDYEISYPE